jgi:uncharacterized protein YdeI (YjbR/CyaY-like superfamily)
MAEIGKRQSFQDRDDWRAWLTANYDTATELWLVLYKKHTSKPTVSYNEAVEEALCFGWIDGIIKGIDEEKHAIRFSPRRRGSIWSESNKKRVTKMVEQGRMTEIGLAKVEEAKANGEWDKATQREDVTSIPPDLQQVLQANKQAQRNFADLAPSHKRQYVYWITSAKTEATRQRRIQKTVEMVKANKRPGMA